MPNTVYDTSFLAKSNGGINGRKHGSVLDRRLCAVEGFLNGNRVAWYNNKLLNEYTDHIKSYRNDILDLFFRLLEVAGRKTAFYGQVGQAY